VESGSSMVAERLVPNVNTVCRQQRCQLECNEIFREACGVAVRQYCRYTSRMLCNTSLHAIGCKAPTSSPPSMQEGEIRGEGVQLSRVSRVRAAGQSACRWAKMRHCGLARDWATKYPSHHLIQPAAASWRQVYPDAGLVFWGS
jgi:hypothetical protein